MKNFLFFELIFFTVLTLAAANSCQICQEQGVWSEWSGWSLCQQQYGTYSQTRTRTCSNSNCYGANSESIACVVQRDPTPSPAPEWNQWGAWSTCSASCGGGFQYRQRTCNTQCGVCQCSGAATEQRSCNEKACCRWKKWSAWSPCSVTCGDGVQYRTRECTCDVCPSGAASQQRQCSEPACPVHCPICEQPTPPPPTCNICEPPTPPCSACGYYGRKKRQQALENRKMINSMAMVIPAGTNFTSPLQQQPMTQDRLPLFVGMKD